MSEVVTRNHVSSMGRSRVDVTCPDGHVSTFYLWAWAGRGMAKCKHPEGCAWKARWMPREWVKA